MTNQKESGIISRLSRSDGARSLKIEQQGDKYKAKLQETEAVCEYRSRDSEMRILLNKSKEQSSSMIGSHLEDAF